MIVTCRDIENKIILNYLFREKILPNLDGHSIMDLFPKENISRDIFMLSFLKNANFFIIDPSLNVNLFKRELSLRGINFKEKENSFYLTQTNVRVFIFRRKFKNSWREIKRILKESGENKIKYAFALYILERIKNSKFKEFLRNLSRISENLVYSTTLGEFPLRNNTKLLDRKNLELLTKLNHEFSNIYACNLLEKRKIVRAILVGLAKLDLKLVPSSFFDFF